MTRTLIGLTALIALAFARQAALAQGATNNVPGYPQAVQSPNKPARAYGMMPAFTDSFWNGATLNNRPGGPGDFYLNPGTVLTGVLADKLSSKNNKVGDIFAIVLTNGYACQGQQILPPGSKIIGAVVSAVPAHSFGQHATPGQLQVSLQALVLPDGRSTPIRGFIERNPNLELKENPNKPKKGPSLLNYQQAVTAPLGALANSVTRSFIGQGLYHPGRTGIEFSLDQGELLPVKLNGALNVSALMRQPVLDPTQQAN